MDCTEARDNLLARRRGTLGRDMSAGVDAHLAECEVCRREDAADRELTVALEERLRRRRAPDTLHRSVAAQLAAAAPSAVPGRPRPRLLLGSLIAAALAAAAFLYWTPGRAETMLAEAVNDHLRVLYSEHPIEVESGGVHQVKPWFAGRVDFAPVIGFGGDDDFPLQGGAVAYFIDRKAAAYIYKRRLHTITLFVFRADGLPWPAVPTLPLGHVRATEQTTRGFHALVWRDGDLGYALVSDLDLNELETLGSRIAGP
jgi:anti-sigma factor RsiW